MKTTTHAHAVKWCRDAAYWLHCANVDRRRSERASMRKCALLFRVAAAVATGDRATEDRMFEAIHAMQ